MRNQSNLPSGEDQGSVQGNTLAVGANAHRRPLGEGGHVQSFSVVCTPIDRGSSTPAHHPAVHRHVLPRGTHLDTASRGGVRAPTTPGSLHEGVDARKRTPHVPQVQVHIDYVMDAGGDFGKAGAQCFQQGSGVFSGSGERGVGKDEKKGVAAK